MKGLTPGTTLGRIIDTVNRHCGACFKYGSPLISKIHNGKDNYIEKNQCRQGRDALERVTRLGQ